MIIVSLTWPSPLLDQCDCKTAYKLRSCCHILVVLSELGELDLEALTSVVREIRAKGRPKKRKGPLLRDDAAIGGLPGMERPVLDAQVEEDEIGELEPASSEVSDDQLPWRMLRGGTRR